MKKIFIGCGVLALIVLGILGFMAYQIVPVVMEAFDSLQVLGVELVELEEEYPFDESEVEQLDPARFISALEFRVDLASELDLLGVDLTQLGHALDEEGPSFFDMGDVLLDIWNRVGPVITRVPDMLRQQQMSASEFGWNSRVMWAALRRIDAGVADDSLEPLRGQFDAFRRAYAELEREDNSELPPLDDLIGDFDSVILDEATAIFSADPQRVLDGTADPVIEIIYLSMLRENMQQNSSVHVRVNGKDVIGGSSEDSTPPADG